MAKLVWRVKLVAELQAGVTTEVEVGRLERDEQPSVADLGLRLAEAKRITAALQAEMVNPPLVSWVSRRWDFLPAVKRLMKGWRHPVCPEMECIFPTRRA